MQTWLNITTTLHTGSAVLHDFSSNQHFFHWTGSFAIRQPEPLSGLLQDMGHQLTASLSFNVNELKKHMLSA